MTERWQNLKDRLQKQIKETSSKNSVWIWGIVIAGFFAFYWDHSAQPPKRDIHEPEPFETAATFIPAGYVLVPIEVENYESLDSILGKHGVVDLYRAADPDGKRSIKVAERVKILRAPLNPRHFAVLAPETESQALVSYAGPYTVVVQNPAVDSGTRIVSAQLAPSEETPISDGEDANHPNSRSLSKRESSTREQRKAPRRSRIQVEVNDAEES